MADTVLYESDGRIGRITLNRPEVMNAINDALPHELADCVRRANDDAKVHVIVLSGKGPAFCAGYDLTPDRVRAGETVDEKDKYADVYRSSQSFDDDTWRMEDAQRDRMAIFDMQ